MAKKSKRWSRVTTVHSFKDLKTVRVFGIARVSTDKQAKKVGESLDHQKEVLANWVKAKSSLHAPQEWKLVEAYVENEDKDGKRRGRSATTRDGRQGLEKALELAKAKLIDTVVVTKLDRIARNVRDYVDISAEFNKHEVALVCLDLDIDTSTPDGQMIMRNHANLAQWQAERIAQYSVETVKRHVDQGRPIGPPPLGYKVTKNENGKTTFVVDPVYKKHVEMMEKLYLKLQSIDQVVLELHKKGYKTPRGKTYTKPRVSRTLQNIRYLGEQEYDGKIFKGNWSPLRSLALHERIQSILKANRRTKHSPNRAFQKYVYLLQGLLKCPRCHSTMMPRPGIGGSKGKQYYPYYVCMKAEKTRGIDCERTYLASETIDNAVIEFIRKLHLEPKIIEQVVKRANQATSGRLESLEADLERIRKELKDTRTKISNLVDILADKGMAELKTVKSKLESLNKDEQELIIEEKRLEQEMRAEKSQAGEARDQIQTLSLFNDLFLLNQDEPERIKAILPRFVNYIVCHITDKKKGIGRLDVGLFGKPFVNGKNAEIWNETLEKLAEHYNRSVNSPKKCKAQGGNAQNTAETIQNARIVSALGAACGTEGRRFAAEYKMG